MEGASRRIVSKSAAFAVRNSPARTILPSAASASQATRALGSRVRNSSRMESDKRSQSLSGCPAETDSEVNSTLRTAIETSPMLNSGSKNSRGLPDWLPERPHRPLFGGRHLARVGRLAGASAPLLMQVSMYQINQKTSIWTCPVWTCPVRRRSLLHNSVIECREREHGFRIPEWQLSTWRNHVE